MTISIGQCLAMLKNTSVAVADGYIPDERGTASVVVSFSDGTILRAFYWRLIEDGRAEQLRSPAEIWSSRADRCKGTAIQYAGRENLQRCTIRCRNSRPYFFLRQNDKAANL